MAVRNLMRNHYSTLNDYARDIENKDTDLTTGSPFVRQSQGSFVPMGGSGS
jgi:hypothetical protein